MDMHPDLPPAPLRATPPCSPSDVSKGRLWYGSPEIVARWEALLEPQSTAVEQTKQQVQGVVASSEPQLL